VKTALVTGSSGFVGSHMMAALLNRGYEVSFCDIKDSHGHDAIELFKQDDTRFDLVVHAASVVGGRVAIERRPIVQLTDFELDSLCIQHAVRTQPGRVVLLSSSAVYPIRLQGQKAMDTARRLHEDDVFIHDIEQPDPSLYGLLKLNLEYIGSFLPNLGVPTTIVRPFSGYGGDQDEDYPFPSILRRVLNEEDPIDVWGPGNQVRDFLHIDDFVEMVLACVRQDISGPINLCTGRAVSFNQLALMMMAEIGHTAPIQNYTDMPTGVLYRVGDPTQINKIRAANISLEQGIKMEMDTIV
jgi:nucleoside-diphosphate-sugar epimerase